MKPEGKTIENNPNETQSGGGKKRIVRSAIKKGIVSCFKSLGFRNSLAVQWLGLLTFTAKDLGSIPVQGTKIPQAARHGRKKKKPSSFGVISYLPNK